MEMIVYDEISKSFRGLDETNYNDDIVCGTVFLQREALTEIKKYFQICGYILISYQDECVYPIDIHKDKVVLFEGTYNNMPEDLKKVLIKYNIKDLPNEIWSSFFFNWQFMCDMSVFEKYGSFIKLCKNILRSQKRYGSFLNAGISIYAPITYEELCEFTRNIFEMSKVDVFSYDYYDSIKYLIDSLIKGYHINFKDIEIEAYLMKISQLIDERWEE